MNMIVFCIKEIKLFFFYIFGENVVVVALLSNQDIEPTFIL